MIYCEQRPARVRSDCDVMSLPGASRDVWKRVLLTISNNHVQKSACCPGGFQSTQAWLEPQVGSSHTCWTLELTQVWYNIFYAHLWAFSLMQSNLLIWSFIQLIHVILQSILLDIPIWWWFYIITGDGLILYATGGGLTHWPLGDDQNIVEN